jgi:putative membrane protein
MKFRREHAINWKVALLRVLINGLSLAVAALLVPNIKITTDNPLLAFLILGASLGILNALVKPIIQFLTLSLLFSSYGVVVVIINSVILMLLALIFDEFIEINSLIAAFLGGAVIGLVSMFLEYALGVTPPIVDDTVQEAGDNE